MPSALQRFDNHLLLHHRHLWESRLHYLAYAVIAYTALVGVICMVYPVSLALHLPYPEAFMAIVGIGSAGLAIAWFYHQVRLKNIKRFGPQSNLQLRYYGLVFSGLLMLSIPPLFSGALIRDQIANTASEQQLLEDVQAFNAIGILQNNAAMAVEAVMEDELNIARNPKMPAVPEKDFEFDAAAYTNCYNSKVMAISGNESALSQSCEHIYMQIAPWRITETNLGLPSPQEFQQKWLNGRNRLAEAEALFSRYGENVEVSDRENGSLDVRHAISGAAFQRYYQLEHNIGKVLNAQAPLFNSRTSFFEAFMATLIGLSSLSFIGLLLLRLPIRDFLIGTAGAGGFALMMLFSIAFVGSFFGGGSARPFAILAFFIPFGFALRLSQQTFNLNRTHLINTIATVAVQLAGPFFMFVVVAAITDFNGFSTLEVMSTLLLSQLSFLVVSIEPANRLYRHYEALPRH